MVDVVWYPGLTLAFDPSSVEDINQDWAGWLDGEAFSVDTPPAVLSATGVTAVIATVAGTIVQVRVSDMSDPAAFTIRATSASGRVTDRTVRLEISQL